MDWNTSVQNLLNWTDKGAMQLNELIPALKKIALQDGANVNVDETWLRYHAYNKKRKTYMWCLVNRKARIVSSSMRIRRMIKARRNMEAGIGMFLRIFLATIKSSHCRATATTSTCILMTNSWIWSISAVWHMQGQSSSMPTTRAASRQGHSLS